MPPLGPGITHPRAGPLWAEVAAGAGRASPLPPGQMCTLWGRRPRGALGLPRGEAEGWMGASGVRGQQREGAGLGRLPPAPVPSVPGTGLRRGRGWHRAAPGAWQPQLWPPSCRGGQVPSLHGAGKWRRGSVPRPAASPLPSPKLRHSLCPFLFWLFATEWMDAAGGLSPTALPVTA